MKKIIIIFLMLILVGGLAWYLSALTSEEMTLSKEKITSFEECVTAGYAIMESYPRQCKTSEGKTFVEEIEAEIENETAGEQACIDSGGIVEWEMCCLTVNNFPNLCLIGACGCSSDNNHEVKICNCGEGKCFDGEACISQ